MIILVDFENTHASGLEGYTYLNESDTLVMYYSDENSAVTKGVVEDLRKNGVHVRLVKLLKQHSNALDMYIASTTGMFLDSGEKICIVSKDHGYAAVRDFWHSLRGAEILLGETIKQCLLSSELNDEARIRLCKEREQKAMLVDAFTTMNTIPTRPTLSRSNQRRRRNDTRNFMEVSEPVAILPNPLMHETPADQLAKELSSATAKSENTAHASQPSVVKPVAAEDRASQKRSAAREAQADSAAQQEMAMTTSVSADNASDVAAVTEAEASTTAGRSERGGRGRNGRNRRNDQNHRNDRNDRSERDDQNEQNRSDATAAEKTDSEQRTGRDADARTRNTRSTRDQADHRREQNSAPEQNAMSEPVQERFGGYDGIMKMNEASRIALDKRQEREEKKDEKNGTALTQVKPETAALVKTEKKTAAVAKVDPNRVQFVWDPATRSMKRVGVPAEENGAKKDDASKTDAAKTTEAADEKTAEHKSEKDRTSDAEKNPGAAGTKTIDVSGAAADHQADAADDAETSMEEKTAVDGSTSEDGKQPAAEAPAVRIEAVVEKAEAETDVIEQTVGTDASKTDSEVAPAGQHAEMDGKKVDVETKKSGAHRKSKKSASVKKESDASEKPASSSKPEGKKKADAVKHEKASEKDASASAPDDAAKASEKSEMNAEAAASASKKTSAKKSADHTTDTAGKKKSVKKASAENRKSEKSPKKVEDDVTADVADAQPALQMSEEDIQLTKKKYSEGINTLHTYYVRLMKAFGREQGRVIYESTKKSVQEDIKTRKAQLASQPTTTEAEEN